jgi:hypothetical protein
MDDDWTGFWIGSELTRRLEVTNLGLITDTLYGFSVAACADGFSAEFQCETMLGDLAQFRDQVQAMYATLQGTAELRFIDDSVSIDGDVNRYGHVHWRIRLAHSYGENRSVLEFTIREDQTLLWNVAAKITTLLEVAAYSGE